MVTLHSELQRRAYAAPWSNSRGMKYPPMETLPSGERIALSLNK